MPKHLDIVMTDAKMDAIARNLIKNPFKSQSAIITPHRQIDCAGERYDSNLNADVVASSVRGPPPNLLALKRLEHYLVVVNKSTSQLK